MTRDWTGGVRGDDWCVGVSGDASSTLVSVCGFDMSDHRMIGGGLESMALSSKIGILGGRVASADEWSRHARADLRGLGAALSRSECAW